MMKLWPEIRSSLLRLTKEKIFCMLTRIKSSLQLTSWSFQVILFFAFSEMRLFDMCVEKNVLNSFRYHKFLTVFRVDFVINQAKTFLSTSLKVRRPHGLCARSPSRQSRFRPWLGTQCCVLGQDTLLSQCLSPSSNINGYRQVVGET